MRQSQLFTKTRREAPADEASRNAELLLRGGFIHKELAGVYSLLPLGLRVREKIKNIIREEMNRLGGQEVHLSTLQDRDLWEKTGRWSDEAVDNWFKTELKSGSQLGLGFTHEEPLTAILKNHLSSYKDLPVYIYQFQTKFRNELRAKSGLLRGREFLMKDLYSFCRDQSGHEKFYKQAQEAYRNIFKRVGIGHLTYLTYASGGVFSEFSHEFQTLLSVGEDTIFLCRECNMGVNKEIVEKVKKCPVCGGSLDGGQNAVEVGNIFPLGLRFSEALGLNYRDEKGQERPVFMGSYGIGLERLMAVMVEAFSDERGIIWPAAVAPFKVHLLALPGGEKEADAVYGKLSGEGIEVLYDDRPASAGEKFADADLIGLPWRVVVSEKSLAAGGAEIKKRAEKDGKVVPINSLAKSIL